QGGHAPLLGGAVGGVGFRGGLGVEGEEFADLVGQVLGEDAGDAVGVGDAQRPGFDGDDFGGFVGLAGEGLEHGELGGGGGWLLRLLLLGFLLLGFLLG